MILSDKRKRLRTRQRCNSLQFILPKPPVRILRIHIFFLLLVGAVIVLPAMPAYCQSKVLGYTGRIEEKRPELLEQLPTETKPVVKLPAPTKPSSDGLQKSFGKSIFIRKINVIGTTVFTPEEIGMITSPYENRSLSMEDLESLRRKLTLLYVKNGFINSGAIIPDQQITGGQINFEIIEGKLVAVNVDKSGKFTASYLEKRIELDAGSPLNIVSLQERLQLLQQDSRIQKIKAELKPGARPGEAVLHLEVEEKPPISLWLAFNNYQSPTIGEELGITTFEHMNLTGHGDILRLTGGISEGVKKFIDIDYTIPINAYDTTLQFKYTYNDQDVVDDIFGPLDITSKEEIYGLTLRHPLYRSLTHEFAISLSIDRETNRNYMLGQRFSFSPGEKNGRYTAVPLRFSQEWLYRTQKQVIAARSRLSFGLDTFGATINHGEIPDGKFFAWLGQFQYVRILDFLDIQLLARADVQYADRSLLPIEQMGIGGRYSVRGYRENTLVTDQALVTSLETRIPLVQNVRWADYLHFCQFIDYGAGDDVDYPSPSPSAIYSTGLGLRWRKTTSKLPFDLQADAEIYWGYQLRDVDQPDNGPQNNGIHYQIAITGYF